MVSLRTVIFATLIATIVCQRGNDNNRGGKRGRKQHKYDPNLSAELNACHDEIDDYRDCMKAEVELKKQKFATEQSDDFKKKVANCFTLHGCEYKPIEQLKPVEDPIATAKLAKFDEFWSKLDITKQNCFTKEVRDEFVDKLNSCVNKSAPGYTLPVATDGPQSAQDDFVKGRKVGHDRDSVRASLKNCRKGSKDVQKCIKDLREPLSKPSCDLLSTCSKPMSAKCLNALTQLKRIACSCLDKQHKAIAGKLGAAKRKGNRKNRVKASTDDSEDLVNNIQTNCNIQFSTDVQNAADNIPDSLQQQAAEYVDAQAEQQVGFCQNCGKN